MAMAASVGGIVGNLFATRFKSDGAGGSGSSGGILETLFGGDDNMFLVEAESLPFLFAATLFCGTGLSAFCLM